MTKSEIRKNNLKKRKELCFRKEKDEKLLNSLLSCDFYKNAKTVMTYISYKSEIDTKTLIMRMLKDKKRVCAPVCFENGIMEAFEFSDFESLEISEKGILEPDTKKKVLKYEIDLIIVPGCAFNKSGFRVGYGGGFYDRYLQNLKSVTCGLFYEELKTDFSPDETDIPLNFIITEENIYKFKREVN